MIWRQNCATYDATRPAGHFQPQARNTSSLHVATSVLSRPRHHTRATMASARSNFPTTSTSQPAAHVRLTRSVDEGCSSLRGLLLNLGMLFLDSTGFQCTSPGSSKYQDSRPPHVASPQTSCCVVIRGSFRPIGDPSLFFLPAVWHAPECSGQPQV